MGKIKLYMGPTCPWCKKEIEFLEKHGIDFEQLNVSEDDKARETMHDKSGQMGIPVLDVHGKLVIGFDKEKICEVLGLSNES